MSTGCSIRRVIWNAFAPEHSVRRHAHFIWLLKKSSPPMRTCANEWPVDGTTGYEFTNQVLGLSSIRRRKRHSPALTTSLRASRRFRRDRARRQDPHHGKRNGERAQRACSRCGRALPDRSKDGRLHAQHPPPRFKLRSWRPFPSTAPISTLISPPPWRIAAISIGRWRKHDAIWRMSIPASSISCTPCFPAIWWPAPEWIQPPRGTALRDESFNNTAAP